MAAGAWWINQGDIDALILPVHDAQHALKNALRGGDIAGAVERGAGTSIRDGARLRLDGMDMGDVIGEEEGEEADAAVAVECPVSAPGAQRRKRLLHQHRCL